MAGVLHGHEICRFGKHALIMSVHVVAISYKLSFHQQYHLHSFLV